MTQLLAESPFIVALMLGVLASGLIFGWLQSGEKWLVRIGLLLLALIPVAWWISENWVTDRERIERVIFETADAVEANDHQRAVSVIGDEATRRRAAAELPNWVFTRADVGNIRRIQILETMSPLQADVELTVNIELSSKRGGMNNVRAPRRLLLTFEKRGADDSVHGGWVVTDYQHLPLIGNGP